MGDPKIYSDRKLADKIFELLPEPLQNLIYGLTYGFLELLLDSFNDLELGVY